VIYAKEDLGTTN